MSALERFTTKSGKPITIGTGTGTKWQWLKKSSDSNSCDPIVEQIKLALKNGFNHVDTAEIYTTAPEVGTALKEFGAKREDFWVTTKYSPCYVKELRARETLTDAIKQALVDLKTDYIDLFLIHTPFFHPSFNYTIESIWKELVEFKKNGTVRHIGVSNYTVDQIKRTIEASPSPEYYPEVNQIEFHPNLQNQSPGIVDFCQKNDILVEAYNPLASLFKFKDEKLSAYIDGVAEKYDKTNSQVILRWVLHHGVLPITTSSNEDRIKASLNLDFALTPQEVADIDAIGASNHHRCFFPEEFE